MAVLSRKNIDQSSFIIFFNILQCVFKENNQTISLQLSTCGFLIHFQLVFEELPKEVRLPKVFRRLKKATDEERVIALQATKVFAGAEEWSRII